MTYVKKVNNMCLNGNLSENWRRFKQNYDIFEEAAGMKNKPENVRIALFLNAIGEEAVELSNTFGLSANERKSYTKIRNAFESYFKLKNGIIYERFKFFSRRQSDCETLKNFLADLIEMAPTCGFDEQKTLLIRDQFVLGIADKTLQAELLLLGDDLTLDKIVEMLEKLYVAKQEAGITTAQDSVMKDELMSTKSLPKSDHENIELATNGDNEHIFLAKAIVKDNIIKDKAVSKKSLPKKDDGKSFDLLERFPSACTNCNSRHEFRKCPAFGKNCAYCCELNHFASCCPNRDAFTFKNVCKRCNVNHFFRSCPAFGKKCLNCGQLNHLAICCPSERFYN